MGTLRSHGTPTGTYAKYKWRVVPAPVDAAQRFPLASLPAIDQMNVDVMLNAELQAVLLAAGDPPSAVSASASAASTASATSAATASVIIDGVYGPLATAVRLLHHWHRARCSREVHGRPAFSLSVKAENVYAVFGGFAKLGGWPYWLLLCKRHLYQAPAGLKTHD